MGEDGDVFKWILALKVRLRVNLRAHSMKEEIAGRVQQFPVNYEKKYRKKGIERR